MQAWSGPRVPRTFTIAHDDGTQSTVSEDWTVLAAGGDGGLTEEHVTGYSGW